MDTHRANSKTKTLSDWTDGICVKIWTGVSCYAGEMHFLAPNRLRVRCDDKDSLEWHSRGSELRCFIILHQFLWYAVLKYVPWRGGHARCKLLQWNLGGCIYGKRLHWLVREYSVIFCSHCFLNSWRSYGSVSKHVIILPHKSVVTRVKVIDLFGMVSLTHATHINTNEVGDLLH